MKVKSLTCVSVQVQWVLPRFSLVRRSSSSQNSMESTVSRKCEAARFPSRVRINAVPEGQRQGSVLLLQQAALSRQSGLPAVLHLQLVSVLRLEGIFHRKCLEVVHPCVALHLVLPRISVAARLLAGGSAVVAAAAILRLGVELFMRGARLKSVRRGEMATFWLQIGTHLSQKRDC